MEFQPKSESELQSEMVLPTGTYDFEVIDATDEISKKGNEMIALTLRVFDTNANARQLRDWLVASMGFKLRHFSDTTGLQDVYDSGTINASDCVGRSGRVQVKVELDPAYGPQARVKDYGDPSGVSKAATIGRQSPSAPSQDDDCPF